MSTCDCALGCTEAPDPNAPEPTMCAQCNGDDRCNPKGYELEDEPQVEGDFYMIVVNDVEGDDTMWDRLRRRLGRPRVATCYLTNSNPWTPQQLATNLMLAQGMGVGLDHIEVYARLDLPKYIKPGILPGDPDEEY